MYRYVITEPITDFKKLSLMFALDMAFSMLDINVTPCFRLFEFFDHKRNKHIHRASGRYSGVLLTNGLKFAGNEKVSVEEFDEMLVRIHGSSNRTVLRNKYSTLLELRYKADKAVNHNYLHVSCGFSSIRGSTNLFINNHHEIAFQVDLYRRFLIPASAFRDVTVRAIKEVYYWFTKQFAHFYAVFQ